MSRLPKCSGTKIPRPPQTNISKPGVFQVNGTMLKALQSELRTSSVPDKSNPVSTLNQNIGKKAVHRAGAPLNAVKSKLVKQIPPKFTAKPPPYDYKARFGLLKEQHDTLKTSYGTLKEKFNEQSDENELLITTNDQLKTDLDTTQCELVKSQADCVELKTYVSLVERELDDTKLKLNVIEKAQASCHASYNELALSLSSSTNTRDHVTPPLKTFKVKVNCSVCLTETDLVYRGDWKCRRHAYAQCTCIYYSTDGCTYTDTDLKCEKHESYYCHYITQCPICLKNITGTSTTTTLESHYIQAHGDITHRAGTLCTVGSKSDVEWLIIECEFGRAVCKYQIFHSDFQLFVYTPLPSAQLYKYRCMVELITRHPDTDTDIGHILIRTTPAQYTWMEDWTVRIAQSDYKTYVHDQKVNIKIHITKINDPSQFMI